MLDSVRLLTNVSDSNNFKIVSTLFLQEGQNGIDFYVQLFQNDLGIRYLPENAAQVKIEFLRVNEFIPPINTSFAFKIELVPVPQDVSKVATNPFPEDRSIWSINLLSTDIAKITSGAIKITVTEGTSITPIFTSMSAVRKLSDGSRIEEGTGRFEPA